MGWRGGRGGVTWGCYAVLCCALLSFSVLSILPSLFYLVLLSCRALSSCNIISYAILSCPVPPCLVRSRPVLAVPSLIRPITSVSRRVSHRPLHVWSCNGRVQAVSTRTFCSSLSSLGCPGAGPTSSGPTPRRTVCSATSSRWVDSMFAHPTAHDLDHI